jgi:hypothetical protein
VSNSFQGNYATEPTVKKIEGVEGDTEPADQWVVPSRHDEEGNLK